MQALSEVLCATSMVRHLREKERVKLGFGDMGVDERIHHGAHEAIERGRGVLQQGGFDNAVDLFDVAQVDRGEDGLLIGKVLIDGTDADAGSVRNAVGCDGVDAFAFEDPDNSLNDCVDCLAGTKLARLAAGFRLCDANVHGRILIQM